MLLCGLVVCLFSYDTHVVLGEGWCLYVTVISCLFLNVFGYFYLCYISFKQCSLCTVLSHYLHKEGIAFAAVNLSGFLLVGLWTRLIKRAPPEFL